MNEKIKELILQSYESAVVTTIDPFTQEVVTDYIDGTEPIFNKEKFAELIVRECVTTIETYNNNSLTKKIADEGVYSYEQGAIAGMNESVLVIKQHFGIEE